MIIKLNKFGTTLTSRQSGKEAYNAFLPTLKELAKDEKIIIDFDGVSVFSPSWGDEFLTPLYKTYNDKLFLQASDNLSVTTTIEFLEDIEKIKYQKIK